MIEFKDIVYDLEYSFSRKLLHEALDDEFQTVYEEPTDEASDELEKAHTLISSQNVKELDKLIVGFDIQFKLIGTENMISEALKSNGYPVQQSFVSSSLYSVNDDGEETRISEHKRPAYQIEGRIGYEEHDYDNELIIDDNKITLNYLKDLGFSKLDKPFYYFK